MNKALLTDFYQLSMAYGYWQLGIHEQQTIFHLFCRRKPIFANYIVSTGLSSLINHLKNFQYAQEDLDYLRSIKNNSNKPYFSEDFLKYLETLRFTGDIDAVPEGTLVFSNEPLLRIKASLLQAQLFETIIINTFNFSSAVSTMASQMRSIVGDDLLFEFGLRRAQGPDGGLTASRSAYLGGFDATANVQAGMQFDIPVVGTMAHSWVMAFDTELEAFQHYAEVMPENVILLVDTYDTRKGIQNAITVGNALKQKGYQLNGIRLDSGDLLGLSQMARAQLDHAGFQDTKIFASGELTVDRLRHLKKMSSPIDGWGVGTRLTTAYEQPALDMVYKLGAIHRGDKWQYKLKISENRIKTSEPGSLQICRYERENKWLGDMIYHLDFGISEPLYHNAVEKELLLPVFRAGNCIYPELSVSQSRDVCLQQIKTFYHSSRGEYPVKLEAQLQTLKDSLLGV